MHYTTIGRTIKCVEEREARSNITRPAPPHSRKSNGLVFVTNSLVSGI